MSNNPQSDSIDYELAKRILLAADRHVGLVKRNFKMPLDYVMAFLKGTNDAINASAIKPTTFAVIMEKSGRSTSICDRSGLPMEDVMRMLPVRSTTFSMFVWHIVNDGEENSLEGKKSALWQDKDGLSFAFGEVNGEFKLVYATGPGLAAA